jgi:hypothetical protein
MRRGLVFQTSLLLSVCWAGLTANGEEADEGGPDRLLTNSRQICGGLYADTISLAHCIERQLGKTDRLLRLVTESYARQVLEDSETQREQPTTDWPALLANSNTDFLQYRKTAGEVADKAVDGMGGKLERGYVEVDLTVDRVRYLLAACKGATAVLPQTVDLTKTDWCE